MAQKTPAQHNEIHRSLLISLAVAVVAVAIFLLVRRPAVETTNTNQPPAKVAAVTPSSFTMISGPITALDPTAKTITTNFSYIDELGKNKTKQYILTVDETTVIQSVDQSTTPPTVATIDFSKLAVDNQIDAIGDHNVAPLEGFAPNTILQYLR